MTTKRIPPSAQLRQQKEQLLSSGQEAQSDLLGTLVRLGAQLLIQEALEQEVTERLERGHYQRREPEEPLRGYRNGYEPARLETAEGPVTVQVPQVRKWAEEGPYRSRVLAALGGQSDVLQRLAVDMYARGLSVRDIEEVLCDADGEPLLSRSSVSELTGTLWAEYEAFCQRDLSSFEVEYLFVDAVYEALAGWGGSQPGVLCAWGICRDGRKVLLHLALGSRESYEACLEFLRHLTQRGLREPLLVTTDGAPGLIRAVTEVWGHSLRQRCLAHKMRNILDKLPKTAREEVKRRVQDVFYAPSLEIAQARAADLLRDYQERYPAAMRAFHDDLDACLVYLHCPLAHHKAIRTTNTLERAFGESRRRTKIIPHFFTERACLKLVFTTLAQASQRWRRVTMTELECQQLNLLRRKLGLPISQA